MLATPPFSVLDALEARLKKAAAQTAGLDASFDPQLRAADPRFGDLQANGVLAVAKRLGKNPRELGAQLLEAVQSHLDPEAIKVELSGPGFLSFRFQPKLLEKWLATYNSTEALRAGASGLYPKQRVVIDFSAPNTAKQMHVGHIRSTVIGEALARILRLCGAEVITDNHIGDWGTQFGIIILAIKRLGFDWEASQTEPLQALEDLYREGNALFKEDLEAQAQARQELVALQQGDPENTQIWEHVNALSYKAFQAIYDRLDVHFDCVLGESFYRDKVEAVYEELQKLGIAQESEGALVVFHPEHPRFSKTPFIIRKSDGASNYATTDLATIAYRTQEQKADSIIYVVDARQQDHFEQLFLTAQKWLQAKEKKVPSLRHVRFGTILGKDGKAIKTRAGGTVKLKDLLDEAQERAYQAVSKKNPSLCEAQRKDIAQAVGLGAVRYADLMQNRSSDYIFDWDKLLAFEGNTAPYLLYAVARLHSILERASSQEEQESAPAPLETPTELDLAKKLMSFVTALQQSLMDLRPHFLCQYLYELAGTFSTFYTADKVLVDDAPTRIKRLRLCHSTLFTLQLGLQTLGLRTLSQM